MAASFAKIYLHIVFSTRQRKKYLQNKPLRDEMHRYLGGTCRHLGCPALVVGGIEDHVHILCRLSMAMAVSKLVRELKRESSKWIKTKDRGMSDFHWQDGYGAFSISPSHVRALRVYIANQEKHHRTESFQDEYRRVLRKYGIEFDEREVWD